MEDALNHDAARRLTLAALLAAPAALAGCARAQNQEADEGADEEPCQDLIGHPARFLGPNDPMTMDYNPERVNIFHDGKFVITRITWG